MSENHSDTIFEQPRFRCATLDRSDQTLWVAHRWRGATQITWSGKRLSRTMVWTMVALRSDQRAKSGKWSEQWSHYGLKYCLNPVCSDQTRGMTELSRCIFGVKKGQKSAEI